MEYYFAYGPEAGREAMKRLVPTSRVRSKALLSGYRIAFPVRTEESGTGVAGLLADETAQAEGVVYTVTRDDLKRIDGIKQPAACFKRGRVQVIQSGGGLLRAWTHLAIPQEGQPFAPSPGYLDAMIEAATEHAFSSAFITRLQSYIDWAAKPQSKRNTTVRPRTAPPPASE